MPWVSNSCTAPRGIEHESCYGQIFNRGQRSYIFSLSLTSLKQWAVIIFTPLSLNTVLTCSLIRLPFCLTGLLSLQLFPLNGKYIRFDLYQKVAIKAWFLITGQFHFSVLSLRCSKRLFSTKSYNMWVPSFQSVSLGLLRADLVCLILTSYAQVYSDLDNGARGVDALFFDFTKAFDSVPHNELLLKLWKIGVTGKLWQCMVQGIFV